MFQERDIKKGKQKLHDRLVFLLILYSSILIFGFNAAELYAQEQGHDIYFDSVQNWLIMGYTEYRPTINGNYSVYLEVMDADGNLIPAEEIQGLTENPALIAEDSIGQNVGLCFYSNTGTAYIVYTNTQGFQLLNIDGIKRVLTCSPQINVTPLTIPFGTVCEGNSQTQAISVCNDGDCDLTITGITNPSSPFSISGNTCGSTVTPSACCSIQVQFNPSTAATYNSTLTINSNDGPAGVSLNGTAQVCQTCGYSISGIVTYYGTPRSGVTVRLSGAASATATTASNGSYQFTNLCNGTYTVTPSYSTYKFSPTSMTVTISGANVTGQDFSKSYSRW